MEPVVPLILVDPAPTALTSPSALTVATAGFSVLKVMVSPEMWLPAASMGVAWSRTVSPTCTVSIPGVSTTWMTVPVGVGLSLLQAQKPAAPPTAKSIRNAARMKASPQAVTENKGPSASSQSNRRTGLGAVKNAQDSITHRAAQIGRAKV